MLQMIKSLFGHTAVVGIAVAMASTFSACKFEPAGSSAVNPSDGLSPREIEAYFDSATPVEQQTRSKVIVDLPGKLWVSHQTICADEDIGYYSENGSGHYGTRVFQHVTAPLDSDVDMATVFMNGWSFEYTKGDHQVIGLGAAIRNIDQPTEGQISWEMVGAMMDGNGDNPFQWCHRATVVFWNSRTLDAVVWQSDDDPLIFGQDASLDGLYPVRPLFGSFVDLISKPRAVLPRGFGYAWKSDEAHNLFQVAFDYREPKIDPDNPQKIKWFSRTLLKDNAPRRDYYAGEVVSVLSGSGIEERPVPSDTGGIFTMRPQEPRSCDGLSNRSTYEHTYRLRVPEDFAIPMLKAWNIGFTCDDNQIQKIGAWIKDFKYEDFPGGRGGILTYTIESVFQDQDGQPGAFYPEYKVHVLGFNFRK